MVQFVTAPPLLIVSAKPFRSILEFAIVPFENLPLVIVKHIPSKFISEPSTCISDTSALMIELIILFVKMES